MSLPLYRRKNQYVSFFIAYKLIIRVREAKKIYESTIKEIEQLKEETKKFDKLKEEYRLFDESLLSDGERSQFDRMNMIKIIESCVDKKANITNITIVDNQVILRLNHTTLSWISEIVEAFEKNKNTSYITVTNVSTETAGKEDSFVTAEVLIQMVQGGSDS